jgi:hypothetical protein
MFWAKARLIGCIPYPWPKGQGNSKSRIYEFSLAKVQNPFRRNTRTDDQRFLKLEVIGLMICKL